MDVGVIVLAGGYGKRFQTSGQWADKLLELINGKPMLVNVIDALSQISQDIVITTKPDRIEKYKRIINAKEIKIIPDDPPLKVSLPLVGINAGIQHLQNEYILLVAGDMPFIKPELIKILINNVSQNDVTVPIFCNGITQPLLAIYRYNYVYKIIKTILRKKQKRVTDLIRGAYTIGFILEDEMRSVDPELKSLISINRPEEIKKQTIKQVPNTIKIRRIIYKDPHPYWKALNAYLERSYQKAALLFVEESRMFRKYGVTHLELHALYDALNAYREIGKELPEINQRVCDLTRIIKEVG
ncbi:MAG: molybdenum cofactor guanylyltransferase [Thermoprotei archaeon]